VLVTLFRPPEILVTSNMREEVIVEIEIVEKRED